MFYCGIATHHANANNEVALLFSFSCEVDGFTRVLLYEANFPMAVICHEHLTTSSCSISEFTNFKLISNLLKLKRNLVKPSSSMYGIRIVIIISATAYIQIVHIYNNNNYQDCSSCVRVNNTRCLQLQCTIKNCLL